MLQNLSLNSDPHYRPVIEFVLRQLQPLNPHNNVPGAKCRMIIIVEPHL